MVSTDFIEAVFDATGDMATLIHQTCDLDNRTALFIPRDTYDQHVYYIRPTQSGYVITFRLRRITNEP